MNRKKILIVAPFPPPFGGIARYAQDLWDSVELNDEFEFHQLDLAKGEKFLQKEGRSDRSWGRIFFFLKPKNWRFIFFLIGNFYEYVIKLVKIQPDIVHVHTCSYFGFIRSGLLLFLAKPFRCRRILHLHNAIDVFYKENKDNWFFGRLIFWSLNQASEYVVLSENLQNWVKVNLGKQTTVVWNACHSEKYLPQENDQALFINNFPQAENKIVVILIGGLYQHKGAFDLLKVISDLSPEELEKFLFILPGKGDRSKAETFIAEKQLHNYVSLPGMVTEEVKDNLIRNSDIFTLPSYAEGQPIAILEAMSASLPIITSDVGSISEVVEHNTSGFIIKPGDLESLKKYILILANNSELRNSMGKTARTRIDERHDIKRLFEAISNLYNHRSEE